MAKAKAKISKGNQGPKAIEKTPSIRALFRTMAQRKNGCTMAELREAASKAKVALGGTTVGESDGTLRHHVLQGCKGWKRSEDDKGRIWVSPPKAKEPKASSKSKAAA